MPYNPRMKLNQKIAQLTGLNAAQTAVAIELLDAGNTIPFIARYRKEATGGIDDEQLRQIEGTLRSLRALELRRTTILSILQESGALTPALRQKLQEAESLIDLEDLYQPHKKKRLTRAAVARKSGLEPLAKLILNQARPSRTVEQIASEFLSDVILTVDEALAGARDIVAETISDTVEVRQRIREKALKWATVRSKRSKKGEDERGRYRLYYDAEFRVDRIRPHQTLAINRGEAEKVLTVRVEIAERDWLLPLRTCYRPDYRHSSFATQLHDAMEDAANRLLLPAIHRDVRRSLTEAAEQHAISVFSNNLKELLSLPPLRNQIILAIDPAYRTGCKIAVVDATGQVLHTTTIYPHPPMKRREDSLKTLARLVSQHQVTLITIGNGTASRETEHLVAELTRKLDAVHYMMVNEAGASVYSASRLAAAELPGLDVTLRGAVSIARRAQDPLAELVKIDPKSIGVGQYQHDVNQKQLTLALAGVVESVVNRVGVDVNTASPALLAHVSGIGPKLAERVVAYRDENGGFTCRKELMKVHGLGSRAFEQSAGFLRIVGGKNPLDASAIHPESYEVASALLERAGISAEGDIETREQALSALRERDPLEKLAAEMKVGAPTLEDIFEQLLRPGRDPRADMPPPVLRDDVVTMDDLHEGLQLQGTVRNVVDFGAFVDIGVKQDGLLHRSQIPRQINLNVGDIVQLTILKVEKERGRISLGWMRP